MERVKDLILLVYTPREDSNARGYEAWLQEIDNPFFNDIPGIRHYTNWKTTSAADCAPLLSFRFHVSDSLTARCGMGQSGSNGLCSGLDRPMRAISTPRTCADYQVYLCSSATGRNQVISNDLSSPYQVNRLP